ncbi:MAG: hypothetical protein AAF491_08855, partial [Verrucomicrobiota bacterium]
MLGTTGLTDNFVVFPAKCSASLRFLPALRAAAGEPLRWFEPSLYYRLPRFARQMVGTTGVETATP